MGQHKNNPVAKAVAAGKAVCTGCKKIIVEIETALSGASYTCPECAEKRRVQMVQDRTRRRDPRVTAVLVAAAAMGGLDKYSSRKG